MCADSSWTYVTGQNPVQARREKALEIAQSLCVAGQIQPAQVVKQAEEFAEFLTDNE